MLHGERGLGRTPFCANAVLARVSPSSDHTFDWLQLPIFHIYCFGMKLEIWNIKSIIRLIDHGVT